MTKRRNVYLDNNATTKVDEKVAEYVNDFFINNYAVASSQFSHAPGINAKDAVDKARYIIANSINAKTEEIIFTSGATESNNIAISGITASNENKKRNKIIISSIEHFSVLHTAEELEKEYKIEKVRVNNEGFIDFNHLEKLVDDKTLLVSIIHGNHEIGTVQNIKKISDITHKKGAYFHTDAAVSYLQIPIDIKKQGIDLMSISSHKIHGPMGVGGLFVKKGTKLSKILNGGYQEFNLRPGTENVPGIAGFGRAVEVFSEKDVIKIKSMRDYLYNELKSNIPGTLINGAKNFKTRLPNNLNVSFKFIEGESVVLHLDMRGIAVITGSACFSRALQASHILMAMGFTHERAHGSIRYSLSKYNNKADINYTVKHTKEVVDKLRILSPINKK